MWNELFCSAHTIDAVNDFFRVVEDKVYMLMYMFIARL